MGVLPNIFLRPIAPAVERMLNQVRQGAPQQIQAINNSQFTIYNSQSER
jgi:hypothetical protein